MIVCIQTVVGHPFVARLVYCSCCESVHPRVFPPHRTLRWGPNKHTVLLQIKCFVTSFAVKPSSSSNRFPSNCNPPGSFGHFPANVSRLPQQQSAAARKPTNRPSFSRPPSAVSGNRSAGPPDPPRRRKQKHGPARRV